MSPAGKPARVARGRWVIRVGLGVVVFGLLAVARDLEAVRAGPGGLRFGDEARADVALVPSGDPGWARTRAAVELLRDGRVERIVISGAGVAGDSAAVLATAAVAMGAPKARIWVEGRATNTRQNVAASLELLRARGAAPRRLVVVTSALHGLRAGLVAERLAPKLEIRVHPVPDAPSLRAELSEALALMSYRLRGWAPLW